MQQQELIPHLFRTEYRKIAAVLCKVFGIGNMQVAEDLTSETFLAALETWTYRGIPPNPTAWLYLVAKNKAKNHLLRNRVFATRIAGRLENASPRIEEIDIDLSDQHIADSQLQMLFAICHPAIPREAQIGLALRILCGFGIGEIADAFLTNKEVINKRLFRAREKLKMENVQIVFPGPAEIDDRLETVLTTLYLLFNEGYYSESQDEVLREELCQEAMRLTGQLIQNESTDRPGVNALFSLMCFHASRFKARKKENGELILYPDQDEGLWDHDLIAKGVYHLHRASIGENLTTYHLQAAIAYWNTQKADTKEKWEAILGLYDRLMVLDPSPIAALNRIYALSKVKGNQEAILEAEKWPFTGNVYYFTLLAELYMDIDHDKAKVNLQMALSLARTAADRLTLQKKMEDR